LFDWLKARAMARVPGTAVPYGMAAGAVMGLALGGAYLAGALAQDAAAVKTQAARLQSVADQGFTDEAFNSVAARNDASAASLAQPYVNAVPKSERGPTASVSVRDAMASLDGASRAAYRSSPLTQTRDLECLTQAVYFEARGETPAGQAAVAQVVLNRVKSPAFPKSVCGVVFQGAADRRAGCQFSFACDGSTRRAHEPEAWQRARRIATKAMSGQVTAAIGNATHFHVATVQPDWSGLIRVAQVGAHIFYRFGPHPVAAVAKRAVEVQPAIEAYVEPQSQAVPPQVILASVTTPAVVKPEASVSVARPEAKPETAKPAL
jgi:spore germination cell wall hydrolase CwlJ-like protein